MKMPLTPKDLSFLAASAPHAGSSVGLVTQKGYRPRMTANALVAATSPGTPASPGRVFTNVS